MQGTANGGLCTKDERLKSSGPSLNIIRGLLLSLSRRGGRNRPSLFLAGVSLRVSRKRLVATIAGVTVFKAAVYFEVPPSAPSAKHKVDGCGI